MHAMKAYDGVEVQLPSFLTSVLDAVSGRLHEVGKLSRYPFFRLTPESVWAVLDIREITHTGNRTSIFRFRSG